MAKKFKVLVSALLCVTVEAVIAGAKPEESKKVKAVLVCDRLSADEVRAETADGSRPMADVLRRVVKGWHEQNLIEDEDTGKPAEFSPEALDAFLNVAGMAGMSFHAWLRENAAKEKNS